MISGKRDHGISDDSFLLSQQKGLMEPREVWALLATGLAEIILL